MKKFNGLEKNILIGAGVISFLSISAFTLLSPPKKSVPVAKKSDRSSPKITVLDVAADESGRIIYMTGRARNDGNEKAKLVRLKFPIYGSDGALVGHASDTITDLQPGQTWSFKAPVLPDEARRVGDVPEITAW